MEGKIAGFLLVHRQCKDDARVECTPEWFLTSPDHFVYEPIKTLNFALYIISNNYNGNIKE